MNILNKKLLIILITFITLSGFAVWFIYGHKQAENQSEIFLPQSQDLNKKIEELPVKELEQNSTTTASSLKIYRNEEFGFEFQYPKNWEVKENPYGSPFSKFNLIIVPEEGKYLPDPVLVNIVVPDFVDRQFSDLHGTIIQVGGISGIKYEFTDSGLSEIAIILPLGENKIILGANKEYQNVYDQILTSFKFLK